MDDTLKKMAKDADGIITGISEKCEEILGDFQEKKDVTYPVAGGVVGYLAGKKSDRQILYAGLGAIVGHYIAKRNK